MLLRTPQAWLLAVLPADEKLSWKKLRSSQGKGTRIATEEESILLQISGPPPGFSVNIEGFEFYGEKAVDVFIAG